MFRPASMLRVAFLATVLLAVGCSSNNKGKIEGTKWTSAPGVVKGNNIPAGTLGLDFGADGKLSYRTPQGTYTGTYSLGMGNSVTFHLDKELNGKKTMVETVVINNNQLTMSDLDGTSLTFNPVK